MHECIWYSLPFWVVSLCHLIGKLFAAEDMEMQVLDGLAAVLADVGDHAIAVTERELGSDLGDHGEDVSDDVCILRRDRIGGSDMRLGNDQAMHGRLGCNVEKRVAKRILVYLVRGNLSLDDSTE